MSNDFDDATQLGSIGHNPSVPSQPGQQQPALDAPDWRGSSRKPMRIRRARC